MVTQSDLVHDNGGENTRFIAERLTPTIHAEVENEDPGNDTNILSSDVSPAQDGYLSVRVTIDEAVGFSVEEDVGATGSDARSQDLNDGNNLTANAMQRFAFEAKAANGYNFQVSGGTLPTVVVMVVTEHPLGGPV